MFTGAWLGVFGPEDRQEMLREFGEVIARAQSSGDTRELEATLYSWYATALALRDDRRARVLLSKHKDADFIEVQRPEEEV